jgi:hypothetical protein
MQRTPSSLRGRLDTNNLRTSKTILINQSMINFGTIHIILRIETMLSYTVHKGRRWRLNIKVNRGPSQREAEIASFINLEKLWYLLALSSHCPHHRHLEWLKLCEYNYEAYA